MKTEYVVGFLFVNPGPQFMERKVVLIRKNKPEWQKGRLNGVGGKVEEGETPFSAMVREFQEETGEVRSNWKRFATMKCDEGVVHFFWESTFHTSAHTTTQEEIEFHPVRALPSLVLPNLNWIIPLAIYDGRGVVTIKYEPCS